VPVPPMSNGRLLYSSAWPEVLPGSPLSTTFFLLPQGSTVT